MADTINAQERLENVNNLIMSCDAVANEIEGSFAQFDATLADAEAKSKELINDIDESQNDVVTNLESFTGELLAKVTGVSERVGSMFSTVSELISLLDSQGDKLFEEMDTMDSTYEDIKGKIDENVSHMQEVFQSIAKTWTTANDQIESLQKAGQEYFNENVKTLSETLQSEQENARVAFSSALEEGFNSLVGDDLQPHLNDLSSNLTDNLIPFFQTELDSNKTAQEMLSNTFIGDRAAALENMFGSAETLYRSVEGVMDTMSNTVEITSTIADTTVDAMDMTNIGLNQLTDAVDNVVSLLGGLSLD